MEARRPKNDTTADAVHKRHRDLVWEHRVLWVLVLGILGLAGYYYVIGRVDRQLRGEILKRLGEKFPKHLVQLERAHLEKGKAIVLEGLEVSLPTNEGPRSVVRAQRVLASGPIDLVGLLQGRIPVQHVRIDGLEISLWPIDETQWSLQSLSSQEAIPAELPPIDIHDGFVRVGGPSKLHEELICHDLKAMLRGSPTSDIPVPLLPNEESRRYLTIQASVSSSYFRRLHAVTRVRADKKAWDLQGELEDMDFSDRLMTIVPQSLREKWVAANGLVCKGYAKFGVGYEQGTWNYEVRGGFQQGRLEHPLLPYRLDDLGGNFFCQNGLLQIRNTKAKAGSASFQLDADVSEWGKSPRALIKTQVTNLALDGVLYKALPEPIRATWDKLAIAGTMDANVEVAYQEGKWNPVAKVWSRGCSLQADVFPYPIQNLQGEFIYRDGMIIGENLTALANGQPLRGSLHLERASPRWLIDLQVASEPVAIDSALIAALTPRGTSRTGLESFVRSLQPVGSVQVTHARFVRTRDNPDVLAKSIELQVYGGSILYDEFRYPIFDIHGQITVDNDVILLRDFQGRHDSARIHCQGKCISGIGRLDDLRLEFDAQSVPLQEGLQRALPPSVRELWNQAQPSGVLDKVNVVVTRQNADEPLDVRVLIDEAGLVDAQTGSTVSLRPTTLPYLLNDISFHLEYRTGVLNVEMKGYHDFSIVEAGGTCRLRDDGSWGCLFTWLPQTRIIIDQSLLSSLPDQLRQPLLTLDYRGPVNVGGWTLFKIDAAKNQPRAESWNLDLDLEDGKLAGGAVASGIRGSVHLEGASTDQGPVAVGDLMLDALAIKNVPVLALEGRFAIEGDKLLLGREASRVSLPSVQAAVAQGSRDGAVTLASAVGQVRSMGPKRSPRRLIPPASQILPKVSSPFPTPPVHRDDLKAQTLSGELYAYGVGQLSSGRVSLQFHLDNADFRNLLLDLGQSAGEANGKLYVDAQIHGSLQNVKTLSGGGIVQLREAKLYQLPFMIRLLRLMRVSAPNEEGAFESADIRFSLDGDRIPLDEIALDGDIISMRGKGEVNMRRELHMELYTYVGPRGQIAAMLQPLFGNRGATLLQFAVTGTTDQPIVTPSLPGWDTATLEQLFPNKMPQGSTRPQPSPER